MRTVKTLTAVVLMVLATTLSIATPSRVVNAASVTGGGAKDCGPSYVEVIKVAVKRTTTGVLTPSAGYLAVYRSGQGTGMTACALTLCGTANCGTLKRMYVQVGLHGSGSSTIYWGNYDDGDHVSFAGPVYSTVSSGSCASAKGSIGYPTPGYSNQITTAFCR